MTFSFTDNALWSSLPIPTLIIAPDNTIADMNSAAEGFLNVSAKTLRGVPVWDQIAVNDPDVRFV